MTDNSFHSDLLRGNLDLMVLSILMEGKLYGYLLQQKLREATQERIGLTAGTLYPLLHRLEADKLISASWDEETGRRRKWYALTALGRRTLVQRARQWHDYVDCLNSILGPALKLKLVES